MADSTAVALTGTIVLGALAYKGIDLVKYTSIAIFGPLDMKKGEKDPDRGPADVNVKKRAKAEAVNGLVSLLLGCAVGIGLVFLFAPTQLADQVLIGDLGIGDMSAWSKVVFGLALTSLAALMFDGKKAVDNTDTASKVKLSLASERDRQARQKAMLEKGTGVDPDASVPSEPKTRDSVDVENEVAWMHDEFDKVIERMFARHGTP